MELAKLSRKGQVSIPKRLLRALGLEGEVYFLVELSPEGAIVLRPAGVYPVEIYSQARIQEFLEEDQLNPKERERLARVLGEGWSDRP
ncbi:AbrB/MazE/SpoVT family DNA-binding domain-containing protein [Thermus sp.]|uniref:AbrB/MazE/SpoVT family DNA-binding domain-containing protein n=1 Tax=Thermus sp. TaxID=275 RepID=UPI00391D24DF